MKITNNLYINPLNYQTNKNNKVVKNSTYPSELSNTGQVFAYKDFGININFTGRTPEDFNQYNITKNRMPITMKEFLMEDYEKRKIIPPQQVMEKVYEHIKDKDVNSVVDVKKKYPHEPLFDNLHEPTIKPRTSVLSEIEVVKDLGDAPLFKDGTDDFGLYLLKKIYLEGKSENEIQKDFYEKDLNDNYKGLITKEITNGDFRAYGIKFPILPFWNSFINTRNEYKKFRVDMSQFEDKKSSNSHSSSGSHSTSSSSETKTEETPRKRKYNIKSYQKRQIEKDINDSDMSKESVEKTIRRRFTKNDPEATFIVKYLSPIMVVAADRIHLSEELKTYNEVETLNGKLGDDVYMLKRFWKNNPELKYEYAKAITDTIELFEYNYSEGGMVPINNEFRPISESENKHIIDFVTPNFIDFIDQIKNVEIERAQRYEKHDKMQAELEECFANFVEKDELEEAEVLQAEEVSEVEVSKTTVQNALDKAAKANPKVTFHNFELPDGTVITLALDLEEVLTDKIHNDFQTMPQSYQKRLTNFMLNHPKIDERFIISYICNDWDMNEWAKIVNNENDFSAEEVNQKNEAAMQALKDQLMQQDEIHKIIIEVRNEFEDKNKRFTDIVRHSMMEYSVQLQAPNEDYISALIRKKCNEMEENGLFKNYSDKDKLMFLADNYRQTTEAISSMKSHNMVYLNTVSLDTALTLLCIGNDTKNKNAEIEEIMKKYQKPLSNSERTKILLVFMDAMLNMNTDETETFKDELSGYYKASMATLKDKRYVKFKKEISNIISNTIITPDNTTLRYLIDKNADKNLRDAIVEINVSRLLQKNLELFDMIASIDDEYMSKYIKTTNSMIYQRLNSYRIMSALDNNFASGGKK